MTPGWPEVLLALGLVALCALLSAWRKLQQEKPLLWGASRMVAQLMVLGLVLQWLFRHGNAAWVALAAVVMTVNAGIHSTTRVRHRYPGLILQNVLTTFLAIWPVAGIGLLLLRAPDPTDPAITLPLLGMVLGNALNGISLGLDHFTGALRERREQVLTTLALGATPSEATHSLIRESARRAMTPILNAMFATGIVSIPGMMAGQVVAGTPPMEAALYQAVLTILMCVGGFAGILLGLYFCRRRHFDARERLCLP